VVCLRLHRGVIEVLVLGGAATLTSGYGVEEPEISYYTLDTGHLLILKCYMGFCTPRRTVIDFEKKSNRPGTCRSASHSG